MRYPCGGVGWGASVTRKGGEGVEVCLGTSVTALRMADAYGASTLWEADG